MLKKSNADFTKKVDIHASCQNATQQNGVSMIGVTGQIDTELGGINNRNALQAMLNKAYKQNWNDHYPDEVSKAQSAISKALGEE